MNENEKPSKRPYRRYASVEEAKRAKNKRAQQRKVERYNTDMEFRRKCIAQSLKYYYAHQDERREYQRNYWEAYKDIAI